MSRNSNNDNVVKLTPKEWIRLSCKENEYYKARNFLKDLMYKCYWKDGECSATWEELANYKFIDKFLEAGVKEHIDHLSNWFHVPGEKIKDYLNEDTTN